MVSSLPLLKRWSAAEQLLGDTAGDQSHWHLPEPVQVMHRKYPFYVLATNYNYYATVYTCEYSPLIDKHFIYVWILSRNELLNDVSKELAVRSLSRIGVDANKLVKDDWSKCSPKYYKDRQAEPMTFRYPVIIR
ncbi:hypothetical protein HF086_013595 [Spodoptera exigua]|uniref:Lipocalin/cytosolic fatty-acid binding domain-containing protein n=1 Tax=Spodoptera exigua TaxID=7107 RepID=A0A922MUJ7_SPOEX|nr:hypothetical protein HF086_013595 [Spodoptera exigua]